MYLTFTRFCLMKAFVLFRVVLRVGGGGLYNLWQKQVQQELLLVSGLRSVEEETMCEVWRTALGLTGY